jgi:zinc transporter ZupT
MHGLGLSRLVRGLIALGFVVGVVVVYSSRGWANLNEIVRIPVIDYVLVFVLAGLIWLGLRIFKRESA